MSNPYNIEGRLSDVSRKAAEYADQLQKEYKEAEAALNGINAKSSRQDFDAAQLRFRNAANALGGVPTSVINNKIGEALNRLQRKS